MDQISILRQMFKNLSAEEQKSFLELIKSDQPKEVKSFETLRKAILKNNPNPLSDRCSCPHCRGVNVVKNGNVRGVQRFMCKDCKKTFSYTTNTILYKSPKSIAVWEKYCECFLHKFPLRKCADICHINLHTAFNWRHKILDALQNMLSKVTLKGVVESDEIFFPLSFKGSKHLDRDPHLRGNSVSTRGLSQEQVCVPCTVNHHGMSVARISNLGRPKVSDLEKVISCTIEQGSIFVTDSLRGYQKVAFRNELSHIRIPRGKHTSGTFNIQTVNGYHSELKRLVNGNFKGVATKYLNNYVVYHNFVNFAKNTFSNKLNKLKDFVFTTKCLTKGYSIKNRPAIPI